MPKGPSKSAAAIQRLLEERRQYEAWLARITATPDSAPEHVRTRVKADYEARLKAVTEELRAHADAARQLIAQRKETLLELQKQEKAAAQIREAQDTDGRTGVPEVGDGRRQKRAVAAARQWRAVSDRRKRDTGRARGRGRARREDAEMPRMRDDESGDGVVLRKLRRGAGCDVATPTLLPGGFSRAPRGGTSAVRRCFCG